MIRYFNFSVVLLLLGVFGIAHAADERMLGTWRGTIGSSPVIACFEKVNDYKGRDLYSGLYYYLRYLNVIRLSQTSGPSLFDESIGNGVSGHWHLESVKDRTMSGSWTGNNAESLPISLTKISDSLCGEDAFNAQLEKPVRETVGKQQTLNGIKYQQISIQMDDDRSAQTIRLNGSNPIINAINLGLYSLLPTDPFGDHDKEIRTVQQVADAFRSCQHGAVLNQMGRGSLTTEVKIIYVNDHILIVDRHYAEACRVDGRVANWTDNHAWDLSTGKKVDPWRLINEKGKVSTSVENYFHVSAALNKLIVSLLPKKDEYNCRELFIKNRSYSAAIRPNGISFTSLIGGYAAICDGDVFVPYVKLSRFLTPTGKAEISRYFEGQSIKE